MHKHKKGYHKIMCKSSRCHICGRIFCKYIINFGTYSKEQIRNVQAEFIESTKHKKEEHIRSCIVIHKQTRIVIVEKTNRKINEDYVKNDYVFYDI
jgi:hypothetical protein